MNEMNKLILIPILTGLSIQTVNAASNNSNIKISANIQKGCTINAENINFGDVNALTKLAKNNVTLNCSKGTAVNIALIGQTNPDGYRLTFMTIGGKKMTATGNTDRDFSEGLQYSSEIHHLVNDNGTYKITRRPNADVLGQMLGTQSNHTMDILITSAQPAVININNYITNNNQLKRLIPGNYFDNLTYRITF